MEKFLNCTNTGNLHCVQKSSESFGNLADGCWRQQGPEPRPQLKVYKQWSCPTGWGALIPGPAADSTQSPGGLLSVISISFL